MRPVHLVAFAALALALKTLFGFVPALAATLDPLLVVTIVASLPGEAGRAMTAGVVTGVLEDAWSAGLFGTHAFVHLSIAYLLSLVASRVDLVQTVPAALVFALGAATAWGIEAGLALMMGQTLGELPGAGAWIAGIVGNTLLGIAVRALAVRFRALD